MENYLNYIYTKQVEIDQVKMIKSCRLMRKFVNEHFSKTEHSFNKRYDLLTNLFSEYNLFMYPFPEFHKLFHEVRNMFYELKPDTDTRYYIQSWLNMYEKDQFIDWHKHIPAKYKAWHGFYCVDVEKQFSYTSYKLPHIDYIIDIQSEDGLMVLGKSDGDMHKSSHWTCDEPRITIAFNIIPERFALEHCDVNHWIPI